VYSLSPSLWPRFPLLCILNIRQLECNRITLLTRVVIFVFVFYETVPFLLFVVGWFFLFFVAPFSLLAVFEAASEFNQDVSKWNTSAVTSMSYSKYSLLSLSVATPSAVVYFECTTTRVSSDHTSHTFCYFCCCMFLKRYL
jgi:surface protein